jgi:hypothetical protein
MRWAKVFIAIVWIALGVPALEPLGLRAQLTPGAHVSVRHVASSRAVTTVGRVLAISAESLSIRTDTGDATITIPREDVLYVMCAREERHVLGVAAWGGLSGALLGHLLGSIPAGALIGVVGGSIIGANSPNERWRIVELP